MKACGNCPYYIEKVDLCLFSDMFNKEDKCIKWCQEHNQSINEVWTTATQQSEALADAYRRGLNDGMKKKRSRLLDILDSLSEKGKQPMKYRTKPVEIEAIQWTGLNLEEVKNFADDSLIYAIIDSAWKAGKDRPRVVMKIKTLEGDMKVSEGDYIVKGLKGEFYPCKPDVFEMKYEPIST